MIAGSYDDPGCAYMDRMTFFKGQPELNYLDPWLSAIDTCAFNNITEEPVAQ